MFEGVEERLSALAQVAKDLNSVSDEFSNRLRGIEERLAALSLGVSVALSDPLDVVECVEDRTIEDLPPRSEGQQLFLAFGKYAGSWRILVQRYECVWYMHAEQVLAGTDDSDYRRFVDEKPLLDSSRDVRLAAVTQVNALLDAIRTSAQEHVQYLNKALSSEPPESPVQRETLTSSPHVQRLAGRIRRRRAT